MDADRPPSPHPPAAPRPATPAPAAPSPAPLAGPSRRRVWTARGLAAAADALQIFLFPLFGEGFASPADVILDAAMAIALTKLVGFHWSYLPGAALELIPGADLAPTWTAAAWLATGSPSRKRRFLAAAVVVALCAAAAVLWFIRR